MTDSKDQAVTDVIAEIAEALGDETLISLSQVATGNRDMKAELRQQLADVSAERDAALALARQWTIKSARRHAEKEALQLRLNASEARNAELTAAIKDIRQSCDLSQKRDAQLDALLAQSAPATDEQGAGS